MKFLKYFIISALVLVLLLFFAGCAFYFFWYQVSVPLSNSVLETKFTIEQNSGLREIAFDLEKAGLIKDDKFFVGYIYYKGWAGGLQAGEYSLSPSLSIIQIAKKIFKGEAVVNETRITIPEGFNLRQIDARLAAAGLIPEGNLLAQSRKLEGYLFPDTYQFDRQEDMNSIIDKMRENFDLKISGLLPEIEEQGKTLDEIVIMASILEKEVRAYYDKQVASGIFWRRIASDYPLQSCATIAYALGIDKWRYSIEDTKIDSPYNTYQNVGLPPAPICNPGLDSIKAAVYPIETDYNFFLSKPDTGETVFSRTLEEHNENKARYLGY